jgi:hypothetical protein
MLNNIIHEEPVAPIWRAEDLTTNATMLSRFIEELTRGRVQVEREWAERVVRRPASNQHSASDAGPRQLEAWQIDAVNKVVEPRAWDLYERLGYKTPDFVKVTHAARAVRMGRLVLRGCRHWFRIMGSLTCQ